MINSLLNIQQTNSTPKNHTIYPGFTVEIYPFSIHQVGSVDLFLAKKDGAKYLFGVSIDPAAVFERFSSKIMFIKHNGIPLSLMQCPISHDNAMVIRELFEHTRPRLIGIENSYGLGDRIGLANPGHLQAIRNSGFHPVLAQQSIRELTRTNRTPEEVLDAATWAVFQEGYKGGFGADADHLKTTEDIDRMMRAGFTMFTIDPSEYVVNEAAGLTDKELLSRVPDVSWNVLADTFEGFMKRYKKQSFDIEENFSLEPAYNEVLQAIVKYGNVLAHVVTMHNHIKTLYPDQPAELEVSVDETDSPTTLFEHYFIANELRRFGIELVSLAPRFIGDFEKGIDYKGNINAFTEEYKKHIAIAETLGPYKLSIHSGSDKFSVYDAIGRIGKGHVHVKTAGTSYLEALRVVAVKQPKLFRDILKLSCENYTEVKQTYHVSGKLSAIPDPDAMEDYELVQLFDQDDARQVLHVAFGLVLTIKDASGRYVFKDKIISCLTDNEKLHYRFIKKHFLKHIEPFGLPARLGQTVA
jgi:tagaturonate epimerase